MPILYRLFSCLAQFLIQFDFWRVMIAKPYNLGYQKKSARIWNYTHNIYIDVCMYVYVYIYTYCFLFKLIYVWPHFWDSWNQVCQSTWKPFVHRSKSQCFGSNAFKCWIWVRPQSMWFINVYHFPCFSRKLPTILHSWFPGLKDMCCTPIFYVLSSYPLSNYIKMSINGA